MKPRFFFRKNKDVNKDGKLYCVFKLSDIRGKEYSQAFDTGIFISRAQYYLDCSREKAQVTAMLDIIQAHLVVKLGRPCTAFELKEAYVNRNAKPEPPAPIVRMKQVFEAYIKNIQRFKKSTLKTRTHYCTMLLNACQWLHNAPASEMDSKQAETLYNALLLKYKPQTAFVLLKLCNTALNFAARAKLSERTNFAEFKPKPEKPEIVFLSESELNALQNAPSCPALDLFLFMVETGISYVDTQNFKVYYETHDGKIFFSGKRQKTNGIFYNKLTERAQTILQKYGEKPPQIHYQAFRTKLQSAVKACGITKKITGHKARHTLAYRIIERTGNLSLVADMLGDTIATVQTYYGKMTVKGFAEKLKNSGL